MRTTSPSDARRGEYPPTLSPTCCNKAAFTDDRGFRGKSDHGGPFWCGVAQRAPRVRFAQRGCDQGGSQEWWSRPVSRVLCALRRDSHSSRPGVAAWLKQPTRERRGPRHRSPIWSCSGWGLPCRSVARLAVGSYPTVSPLPRPCHPSAALQSLGYGLGRRPLCIRRQILPLQERQKGDRVVRRSAFCCTFRRLAPPRRYLAPCPAEPGLSSAFANERRDCPADSARDFIRFRTTPCVARR